MVDKTTGQIGYDAYGEFTGWRTFDGRPMPEWVDLGERVQGAWQAAADAILSSGGES